MVVVIGCTSRYHVLNRSSPKVELKKRLNFLSLESSPPGIFQSLQWKGGHGTPTITWILVNWYYLIAAFEKPWWTRINLIQPQWEWLGLFHHKRRKYDCCTHSAMGHTLALRKPCVSFTATISFIAVGTPKYRITITRLVTMASVLASRTKKTVVTQDERVKLQNNAIIDIERAWKFKQHSFVVPAS